MEMYSIRVLQHHPLRLALTVGGIALCVVLILFLLSVYRGVEEGSIEYVRHNRADLWVLQEGATNILRASSILSAGHGTILRNIQTVKSASPILFLLSSIRKDDKMMTVYLTGFDPVTGNGGPPSIHEGRNIQNDDEIVLDRSFARKMNFRVGQSVYMKDDSLRVVGLSTGTNMFVIQYAFVTLRRAQLQIGYPGLVTCYMVNAQDPGRIEKVRDHIKEELPGFGVYSHEEFLQNNIHEMESGILPLLYVIALIGAVVLTVILSLLLSINILERRKDFAVMKTLGSPQRYLPQLIIEQALLISSAGSVVALSLFFPIVAAIETVSPEVTTRSSFEQVGMVCLTVALISLLSSFVALRRLRTIYPLEAFE